MGEAIKGTGRGMQPRSDAELIILIAMLAAIGPFSIDTYLPAMPAMAGQFGVANSMIEQTLSAFFLGIAIGQVISGPFSDRYGRRPVLFAGLAVYLIATLFCILAPTASSLVAARFAQGLGASALAAGSRAVVRDLWSGSRMARVMSFVMIVMSVAPLVAPLLGGQIYSLWGWRAIFWFMLLFGLVLVLFIWWRLPETNGDCQRRGVRLGASFRAYATVLSNSRAWAFLLTGGLTQAILYAYITGIPFVYIGLYDVRPEVFGFYFALNVLGLTLGNWLNSRYVIRLGYQRMMGIGIGVSTVGVLIFLMLALTQAGGLWAIVGALLLAVAPVSANGANAISGLLEAYPNNAGAAAAVFGVSQFGFGALAGVLIGVLYSGTATALAWAMAILAAGAVLAWVWLELQQRAPLRQ